MIYYGSGDELDHESNKHAFYVHFYLATTGQSETAI